MRTLRTLEAPSSSKLTAGPSSSAPPTTRALFLTPPAQKSPWHSPVPYLFGGLAAMLGLIAFALLLLACSYWRLSGNSNNEENNGERDIEHDPDGKPDNATAVKVMPIFEEKIVVIMAGDVKPTFLATPMTSRASSFEDGVKKNENFGKGVEEIVDKPKTEITDDNHEENQTGRFQEVAQENQEQN